ncbi:SpoIVB peptidase S55 domain-containing protein [Romboutsia sp.]|uniref:SpoIVB peptidase S55 domain-containing protein n=1 Tax=Romboutsia sp. TaxID=1965302 RepID=UPI002CA1332B|nr:SpoIVB peptidase S55 domain-containing protein [Romboutsia sp.]HSQ88442.1 SpoIVB peptidase S55 domain-containing protein [Romboutsia sp.]
MFKNFKSKNTVVMVVVISLVLLGVKALREDYKELSMETMMNSNKDEIKYVYPLGKVVGVKATTDGVLVIGYEEDNIEYIGGIQKGDNIVKINGQKINNSQDITNTLNKLEKDDIDITFERNNKYITEAVKIKRKNGKSKLGLWVRDKISGIGTVTFYDPINYKFKAIGHAITDVDTNEFLKIKQGNIYNPISINITKGNYNKVGQIKAEFSTSNPIGNFDDNSNFGISGNLTGKINNDMQLVEVGKREDVNLGKASILFEDKNRNIITYDIRIESFVENDKNDRDMVIEVVDENLINYTGGIIQGMSGAPIIQNNKIIGALTHVFKDNHKKGYGVFIDEMIELDRRY